MAETTSLVHGSVQSFFADGEPVLHRKITKHELQEDFMYNGWLWAHEDFGGTQLPISSNATLPVSAVLTGTSSSREGGVRSLMKEAECR